VNSSPAQAGVQERGALQSARFKQEPLLRSAWTPAFAGAHQYEYASGTARDRLDQARILLALHPDADLAYLDRRIREESGGEFGVENVQV